MATQNEKLAVAAHLHVLIRRRIGRVTDTEWMVASQEYAREVLRVARSEPHEDLVEWGDKFEQIMFGEGKLVAKPDVLAANTVTPLTDPNRTQPTERYVGRLR